MNTIKWVLVDSSAIKAVSHNIIDGKEQLNVLFNNNVKHYTYDNVPKDVYNKLLTAPSIGQYFNKNIRNKFNYK